jgi:hypothetical protein
MAESPRNELLSAEHRMTESHSNDPNRTELEELWLLKVKEARRQYNDATAKWREALEAQQQSLYQAQMGATPLAGRLRPKPFPA